MLQLLDNQGIYLLPTGWHEVPTRQFLALEKAQCYTVEQRASFFAGRPIQVNGLVADALGWCLKKPSTEGGLPYPADLGQETFLQVESIRGLVAAQPLTECFGEVYGTFVARTRGFRRPEFDQGQVLNLALHCLELPVTDTYPAVSHCLAELQRLDTAFAVLGEKDETEAGRRARQAGSERLVVFGHLNVARHYAERFGKTIEEVYQWPYQQVMLFLVQDKITSEVTDNLTKQADQ